MLTRTNCSFAGMNFLAHAYLSFNYPEILVGNMISDFVKGKARFGFSGNIQQGIVLHRRIDEFTDNHAATKKAKEIFRPAYRLYSGAIMDILYDHFLANDESLFSESSLRAFVNNTYLQLEENTSYLPANFLHAFTYMRSDNWLFNYRFHHGIQKSLSGLVRRAAYLSESATAFQLFQEHYSFLNDCYLHFFPDVKQYAKDELEKLLL
jgi:acyl carrier protein phosphodiesterase